MAEEIKPPFPTKLENIWASVRSSYNQSIIIGCIYHRPCNLRSESDQEELLKLLNWASKLPGHCIITGDFNLPNINWSIDVPTGKTSLFEQKFLKTLNENMLEQHINKPTRFRINNKPSILDLIITKIDNVISNIDYIAGLGKSDHLVLNFNYTMDMIKKNQINFQIKTKNQTMTSINLTFMDSANTLPMRNFGIVFFRTLMLTE